MPTGIRVDQFKDKVEDFIEKGREGLQDPGRKRTAFNLKPGEQGALTPHGLRHTFAREFLIEKFKEKLDEGLDRDRAEKEARLVTSKVMGHNRISVTLIYAPERLLEEME